MGGNTDRDGVGSGRGIDGTGVSDGVGWKEPLFENLPFDINVIGTIDLTVDDRTYLRYSNEASSQRGEVQRQSDPLSEIRGGLSSETKGVLSDVGDSWDTDWGFVTDLELESAFTAPVSFGGEARLTQPVDNLFGDFNTDFEFDIPPLSDLAVELDATHAELDMTMTQLEFPS